MGREVKAVWCGVVEERVEVFATVASQSILSSTFWRLSKENSDLQDELQGLSYNQLCDLIALLKAERRLQSPHDFTVLKFAPK